MREIRGKEVKITSVATVTDVNQNILEYTIPDDTTVYLTDIVVSGAIADLKFIKRNSNVIWRGHHVAFGSVVHPLTTPIKFEEGQVITVINKVAETGKHTVTLVGVKI